MVNMPVPTVLAVELARLIRLLAMTGKKAFHKFLFEPISYSGWEGPKQIWTSRKYMDRISEELSEVSRLNTVAPHCKRMICQAMTENPSALGDSCIFFLEAIQKEPIVSSSVESIEFAKIIEPPLKEFREIQATRSEKLFEEGIESFSPEELKDVFKPVRLDTHLEKVHLDKEIHTLYQQILGASKSGNLQRCKKLLSAYIIRYKDQESYGEEEINKLCVALEKREIGFTEELNNSMAIELYYQLTKSILEKNLKRSIIQIRKYAHIFEGNPSTPYFLEIDKMERTLYKIIAEKGIMDELKKTI
jgi:hypothetical protein